jgi:hypothetical protein
VEEKDREKAKDRIRKLLNLAGGNPNENEAEVAILKAQELLLKYKIEESELEDGKAPELNIVKLRCEKDANTAWEMEIATILEANFGVILYYMTGHGRKVPVFFGEDDKAQACKDLYEFIAPWLNKRACNYATMMRNKHGVVKGVKQDFIIGFLRGLREKFKEQTASNESYALVVVVSKEVREEYEDFSKGFGKVSMPSMVVHGSREAREAGYQEGKNFSTNQLNKGTARQEQVRG